MRKKINVLLITVAVCLVCGTVFVGIGYFYLNKTLNTTVNEGKSVPYYSVPENANILLQIGNQNMLVVLDFIEEKTVIYLNENSFNGMNYNYNVKFKENLLPQIIDIIGGIDIEYQGIKMNYTSAQIDEINKELIDESEFKKIILEEIFDYLRINGLSENDFLKLLDSVETDIKLLDCYIWKNYVKNVSKNLVIVD